MIVAVLHQRDWSSERMWRLVGIGKVEVDLMRGVQIMIDEHERPITVGTMHRVSGDDRARRSVNQICRGGKDLVHPGVVLEPFEVNDVGGGERRVLGRSK